MRGSLVRGALICLGGELHLLLNLSHVVDSPFWNIFSYLHAALKLFPAGDGVAAIVEAACGVNR